MLVRGTVGLSVLFEAIAFFAGSALHLGIPLPVPFSESQSLLSVVLEGASGAVLLIAGLAILAHRRRAWKLAVAAHMAGVASIVLGIGLGGVSAAQSSHHQPMLLVMIVGLLVLATPPCRHALEVGRRHSKRRQILQTF